MTAVQASVGLSVLWRLEELGVLCSLVLSFRFPSFYLLASSLPSTFDFPLSTSRYA
jgi:hypothetical protein